MRHLCHVGPWISKALLLCALSLAALAGCGSGSVGGDGSYTAPVTGMVTVSMIEPTNQMSPVAGGQPCHRVDYTWTTGGPAEYSNFDVVYATDACITMTGLHVGSTFTVMRQEATSGGCLPSIRTIIDAGISACAAACGS